MSTGTTQSPSASSPIPIQAAMTQASAGIPWDATGQSALEKAIASATGTQGFFFQQGLLGNFMKYLATATWVEATAKDTGAPVWFVEQENSDSGKKMYLELSSRFNPDYAPSGQLTWDGTTYDTIGSLSVALKYDATTNWILDIPISLASFSTSVAILSYGAKAIFPWLSQSVYPAVREWITTACTQQVNASEGALEIEMVAAPDQPPPDEDEDGPWETIDLNTPPARVPTYAGEARGAGEAAGDAVLTEGATTFTLSTAIGLGACVVGVGLFCVPFLLSWKGIEGPIYHSLKVYNITPYDLTWKLDYLASGAMTMAPSAGDTQNQYALDYRIPAMSTTSSQAAPLIQEADFAFTNTSKTLGIGYVLSFTLTDPASGSVVSQARALFNLPHEGENSTFVALTSQDAQSFWNDNQSAPHPNPCTAARSGATPLEVTATFDYLDGKHPTPSGQLASTFNSLLVFSTT